MKKIYLCVPYSHALQEVRQVRFELVNKLAAQLMVKGNIVFSPISHGHSIAQAGSLPTDWKFWKQTSMSFISWADEVHVYMLEGWKESIGVTKEIEYARALQTPIFYIDHVPDIIQSKKNNITADTIETLEWMIADMKWRHNEAKSNSDNIFPSDYSPELQKAINLLNVCKEVQNYENT